MQRPVSSVVGGRPHEDCHPPAVRRKSALYPSGVDTTALRCQYRPMASPKVMVRWEVALRIPWPLPSGSGGTGGASAPKKPSAWVRSTNTTAHLGRGQLEGRIGGKTPHHLCQSVGAGEGSDG